MKYRLVQSTEAPKWFQPEALIDFADVKKGDLGGFIKGEHNLAQDGACWVYDDAKICDNARITGNAKICGHSVICGNAEISGDVIVSDSATIENAKISGSIDVCGYSNISGNVTLSGALVVKDTSIREGTTYGTHEIKASIASLDTDEDDK